MNKFDLNNKNAIITGGAQGFGLDIAKRFVLADEPRSAAVAVSDWYSTRLRVSDASRGPAMRPLVCSSRARAAGAT